MTGRERVLGLLAGAPIDRLPCMPITMMFAAARLGVPYRRYATDHRVLAEAQLRTAQEFGFDHVSCISDPAREAADCGAAIVWPEDSPPALEGREPLLARREALARLTIPDPLGGGRMHDRVHAVALLHERLQGERLLEGWVEGPCALAANLRGLQDLMLDFHDDPQFVAELFEFAVELGARFARAQVRAGADVIGVGDAAASLVGPRFYEELVEPAERRLVEAIHAAGGAVRLHVCGDTRHLLPGMARLGCDVVDLDFLTPLGQARAVFGPDAVLLGNVEPVGVLRDGTAAAVTEAVSECHRQAGAAFIVGAGCEIPRDTPEDNVRAMAAYAHTHAPHQENTP